MFLKQTLFVTIDKLKENIFITHAVLVFFIPLGYLFALFGKKNKAFKFLSQSHRSGRFKFVKDAVEPWIVKNKHIHSEPVKSYMSRDDFRKCFGSRIMVLKAKQSDQEKGVLYVMYSELLHVIPKFMDMQKLSEDYKLVFEPSWSGYCTGSFLYYSCQSYDSYFLAAQADDYRFLTNFENMKAIGLGPCDWVDPKVAEPFLEQTKKYDIVMNSNWGAWKRHRVLFRSLKESTRNLKVALIGFEWGGRTKHDIEALARYYGVLDQLEIFEKISFDEVMNITCQSRLSVLLSLKEGSNRAVAESIFCNVPVIVLSNHVGGIVKNVIGRTGSLCPENQLTYTIHSMLDHLDAFDPRSWAIDNISCHVSTKTLNEYLKKSRRADESWTVDIVARSNSPESKYVNDSDQKKLQQYNDQLENYLSSSKE